VSFQLSLGINYVLSYSRLIALTTLLFLVSILFYRDYQARLGLREGWKEALQSLAVRNVPTFLFSSGYGDIVTQSLLQGGVGEHGTLPQNLRVVSNFFKTGPDGSVRAFSQPIIHDRNKNATTAGRFMGFSVPSRPNALVLLLFQCFTVILCNVFT
jgi:hypothetical protein